MQSRNRSAYVRLAAVVTAAMSLGTLVGCGVAASKPSTDYVAPNQLTGLVLAGRNYMAGATVKIYATQPNGVATNGTYVGTAKLLQTLTASANGQWSTTNVSCSTPDQLYVTAEAGTPYPYTTNATTLSNNPNSLMMTAIGDCSILSSGENPRNLTGVITNEASTVAAVWALRPFISLSGTTVNVTSSPTNYAGTNGVGTTTNFAGLAHAFLNANSLSPFRYGAFVAFTNGAVDITGGGLVPTQELNSLAYVQYLCTVGTADGVTAGNFDLCQQLYKVATPPGGTAPTNSLQAMLNIANYPANNAQAIMTFAQTNVPGTTTPEGASVGPYVPELAEFIASGTPLTEDWSVALYYGPGYGGTATGQSSQVPIYVGIDANDDIFFSNPAASGSSTQGDIIALTSDGQSLWTSPTDFSLLVQPRGITADASGNIWVANGASGTGQNFVQQMSAATGIEINRYVSGSSTLDGIAVDSLGNVWYTGYVTTGQNLHELVKSGTTYTEKTDFSMPPSAPLLMTQVRPDNKNNIWVAGYNSTIGANGAALYFPNTGTAAAPTYNASLISVPITGTGTQTYGIAVDASGNAYVAGNSVAPPNPQTTPPTIAGPGELYKVTVTGSGASATLATSPLVTVNQSNPSANGLNIRFMDTDGVGTIWFLDDQTGTKLYQYVPSSGTLTPFYPCYNSGPLSAAPEVCGDGLSTRLDMSIDSTGSIWVAGYGNTGGGHIEQLIGLAAPTVPLRALGKIGVMP
jgi:hypothetical protein